MWINKEEINALSDNVRKAIDGENTDLRDNREGPLSILKNDINTLVDIKNEQMKSAEKERDLLAEYLADISHQLKTPITSMMVMADLLDTASEEKKQEFIGDIKISLAHMEWLASTLLKMAKLDSGAIEFNTAEMPASELVASAVLPLAIMLDVKDQKVEVVNDSRIVCDRRWTVEALTNVIKNAAEHSPEGSEIVIDSGENPIYRWISVTDSGNGLRKEECAGIFRRFEYSKSETGFGIGLPLALSIMRGQSGDIEIDGGGNGKGATFTLKLYK